MENDIDKKWKIGLAGMRRFFNEGMTIWSKKKIEELFSDDLYLDRDFLTKKFIELDNAGNINFIGNNDVYIKINYI